MSICLIDTTIFCNLLRVPDRDQQAKEVFAELKGLVAQNTTLLLPIATIVETGNHVAHNGNGHQRRKAAENFVAEVDKALGGQAPWTPTPFIDLPHLQEWLVGFPDYAMREIGLADLSIIKEWERQRSHHRRRRIFIWSLDGHLSAYDTGNS